MSYVPNQAGDGANKTMATLAMSFGIAGCFGATLLFWLFWSAVMSVWLGSAMPWIRSFETWIYIAIGGAPFAIAALVMGIVSQGSSSENSETKQMAVSGMLCGITYLAHAVGVFGIWLLYKLTEATIR